MGFIQSYRLPADNKIHRFSVQGSFMIATASSSEIVELWFEIHSPTSIRRTVDFQVVRSTGDFPLEFEYLDSATYTEYETEARDSASSAVYGQVYLIPVTYVFHVYALDAALGRGSYVRNT